MKRNRNQNLHRQGLVLQLLSQQLSQRKGQRLKSPVLEPMNSLTQYSLKSKGCTDSIDVQFQSPTGRTPFLLDQWPTAGGAERRQEARQTPTARRTNVVPFFPTTNTARWKKKIKQLTLDFIQTSLQNYIRRQPRDFNALA